MQKTLAEHEASASQATCVSCHMPSGAQSHAFPGGYDPAFVRGALSVTAARRGCDAVITITPKGVTHAVPTGGLFRRLALSVTPHDVAGIALPPVTRYLRRKLVLQGGKRIEIDDDRPHLAAQDITFILPAAACDGAATYELRYERVAFIESDDEANASIESSFVVKKGSLPGR